jgi:RNA polymerase sigma-70 factor (ECF subfamily)
MERDEVAALLAAWRRGEDREASFRRLVEGHYGAVHRFFVRRGLGAEAARDLTQETFLRVYKGLMEVRSEASFAGWLFQIAANTLRKTIRRGRTLKREAEVALASLPDPEGLAARVRAPEEDEPLHRALAGERRERLARAMAELPPRMRTCLALRVVQGRSYGEIAAAMGLSVETIKAHLYQARQRLAAQLGDSRTTGDRRQP